MTLYLVPLRKQLSAIIGWFGKPERFFLVCGGLFVIVFSLINPPFQAVDEQTHFYRIAQLGEGHLTARTIDYKGTKRYGDMFPLAMVNDVNRLLSAANGAKYRKLTIIESFQRSRLPSSPTVAVPFEGSEVYSPITYLPHVFGYDLASIFTQSVVVKLYLARFADAIAWLLLVWLAIKFTPIGKWTFAALGLIPQVVFGASTLQADAFNIGLCFLFVALVLHIRLNDRIKTIGPKYLLPLLGMMIAIALSKFAYVPLLFFVLLIPRAKLPRPKIARTVLLAVPIVLSLGWEYSVRTIANKLAYLTNGATYGPKDQLHAMLHDPLTGLLAIFNSIFGGASDHLMREMFGTFTWFYLQVPLWIEVVTIVTLILTLLYQLGRFPVIALPWKLFTAALIAITTLAVFLTFYFLWTPGGANVVLGVQGRYFLPMFPLLTVLFTGRKRVLNISQQTLAHIVQAGSLLGLLATVIVIANRFY